MEKYIFLDFDGVLNTPKGKFDQKAIGKLRCLLENVMSRSSFLPPGDCKAWSTYGNYGRSIICQVRLLT